MSFDLNVSRYMHTIHLVTYFPFVVLAFFYLSSIDVCEWEEEALFTLYVLANTRREQQQQKSTRKIQLHTKIF